MVLQHDTLWSHLCPSVAARSPCGCAVLHDRTFRVSPLTARVPRREVHQGETESGTGSAARRETEFIWRLECGAASGARETRTKVASAHIAYPRTMAHI